jgi:hypothetical protein
MMLLNAFLIFVSILVVALAVGIACEWAWGRYGRH